MTTTQQSTQRINAISRPSDDAIEAIIYHATSSRQDVRPLRDTRTQLYVGNLPYRVRWQDLKDLFRKAGTVLRADVSLGPDNRSRGYGTVLLATAEDAGRAVDMFNGYTWQTRVLEVRLDRLLPEYEVGRVGIGTGVMSMSGAAEVVSGISGPPMPGGIASGDALYLGLGIGGSVGGAAQNTLGSSPTSADANPRTSTFPQSFVPSRPLSSLAAAHDPLDFLHSSNSVADASDFQSTDCRTLFVGNLPFHIQWQDLKDLFRQAGTILRADVAIGPDNRSRGFGTVVFATEADAERAVQMFNGYEHNGRLLKVHYDKFPPLTSSTSSLPSAFLPPTSSYATLMPASPVQQHYSQHNNSAHRNSSSSSRQSSTSSTAAHSASSSPLPGHAVQSLPVHSRHGQIHDEGNKGYPTLSVNSHFDSHTHSRVHRLAAQQSHPGSITLPPGYLYDYGPPSMPTSPHEFNLRQNQERGYFESAQQHRDRVKQGGHLKERSTEKVGLLPKRDLEWNRETDSESHILKPLASGPDDASVLDIDSLTTSLASMRYSPGGQSHRSSRVESSMSPLSISASMSVSASGSTSNSSSNPHSTVPSKPPSTKPTFSSPQNLPSISSSSLPAHFGMEGLSLETGLDATGGTMSAGGSRKASFISSAGAGAYDRPHQHPYPPSMSTRTSTDSTSESSGLFDSGSAAMSMTEDEFIGYRSPLMRRDRAQVLGNGEKERLSSLALSGPGSGPSSRAASVGGSRSVSRVGIKDYGSSVQQDFPLGSMRPGSSSSQGHGQTPTATQEGQTKHPHHPGPIALPPPPMTFNPMQMPMMPLSTMTPGHPHGHAPTPHAFPMGSMMNLGMNISPLYHPAHPGSAAMSAMAAAAMHGGGSPSPFGMYPGPPAVTGPMTPLTPHGLPPMTPSMPPFTFFPQQYYVDTRSGGVGAKGSGEEGHREGGRNGEGLREDRSSGNVQSAAAPHQMQPMRLNLNAVQGMFSPSGVAMSPGIFYGRPGQVPHPNPYINAAVGAPVHAVATHPAQSPLQLHPSYQYVAGVPHGGYPYPIPSPSVEPQGYFDHVYLPSSSEQAGGDTDRGGSQSVSRPGGGAVSGSSGQSSKEGLEEEVLSPVQEDVGSSDDEAQIVDDKYTPSRTHSVGHNCPSSIQGRGKFHRSGSDPLSGTGIGEVDAESHPTDNIPLSEKSNEASFL